MVQTMKLQDLKNAVNNIEIDDAMKEEILRNVSERTKGNPAGRKQHSANRKNISRLPRVAATAAGVLLAVGIIGIPVRALVSSLVRERMEEIPAEERQEMVEMVDSQGVETDSYTRQYTAEEKRRMSELYSQYQQGVFPEGELPQADSVEEAESMELCYLTTNSTYYLPDRELTDEEILQIIDFETKLGYAISKRYEEEYADEIAAREQEQKELAAQVADSGGITEEEAVAEAQKWLEKIYGITGEGLELNHYIYDNESDEDNAQSGERNLYMVNWTDMPNRQYYYFYISSWDGSLVQAFYSSGDLVAVMQNRITPAEMEDMLPGLKEKAVSFMTKMLGEDTESYAGSYVSYNVYDGIKTGSSAEFVFVKESGEGYIISYVWDGTFSAMYRTADIEAYRKGKAEREEFLKEHGRPDEYSAEKEEIIVDLDKL